MLAKKGAFRGGTNTPEYIAATASRDVAGRWHCQVEVVLSSMHSVARPQPQTTYGNGAQPTPEGVCWLKDFCHQVASPGITLGIYGTSILDLHLAPPFLKLTNQMAWVKVSLKSIEITVYM